MHPNNIKVQTALRAAGIDSEIVTLDSHARTAVLAAEQLGCEVGAIANSLVFMAGGSRQSAPARCSEQSEPARPLLIMASGAARVNEDVIAGELGASGATATVTKANAAQVREATGQAIGGVAPAGHPSPLRTLVDQDLRAHEVIWAAGGTPETIFPLSFDELVALTGGRVTRVR